MSHELYSLLTSILYPSETTTDPWPLSYRTHLHGGDHMYFAKEFQCSMALILLYTDDCYNQENFFPKIVLDLSMSEINLSGARLQEF